MKAARRFPRCATCACRHCSRRDQLERERTQKLVPYARAHIKDGRGIPHQQLVDLAEKHFSSLPREPPTQQAIEHAAAQKARPDFIGSEVRIRDDTIPTANIAIAVEGVSWKDDNYFTALVTQAIVGNWDRAMGNSPFLGSKLSSFVNENKLANSFMSFSTSYSDTG